MSITVSNDGVPDLKVSINKWGDSGNTTYFPIDTRSPESWNRTDTRGFVMSVKKHGDLDNYYVFAGSKVSISEKSVIRDGKEIHPLK